MERSELSTSVVKWSEGLNNRMSIIIIITAYMAVSYIIYFFYILLFVFCIIV